jgi:hypothetical protein
MFDFSRYRALLHNGATAAELRLNKPHQIIERHVGGYVPNIGKPDVFDLSCCFGGLLGDQWHANKNALLTIIKAHGYQLQGDRFHQLAPAIHYYGSISLMGV